MLRTGVSACTDLKEDSGTAAVSSGDRSSVAGDEAATRTGEAAVVTEDLGSSLPVALLAPAAESTPAVVGPAPVGRCRSRRL